MNTIDLRQFDLNLLVVFEILMVERSVTRAAERLGRTQSAVSHSLSRLRDQFGDPLLVKGGKGMLPTTFALEFREQLEPILRNIQRVVSPRHAFDPTTSQRIFRLSAPDFAVAMFTRLMSSVQVDAPGVSIEWTGLRTTLLADLADGKIDAAIAPMPSRLTEEVIGEPIGALSWRCFGRKNHPAFLRWGIAAWSRWPHLAVRMGDQPENPVSVAVSTSGLKRTIAGWVPNFAAIGPVLTASDFLATVPSLAMADIHRLYDLDSRRVPFWIAPMPHAMLWSSGRSNDPEIRWLRDRLGPIAKSELTRL